MDPVFLSRLQFAAATMFHFLFVPLTLGLSILVAYMETRYVRTKDSTYLRMTKFWGKLFLINFALGVVTGITLEFQFGTNWSHYSAFVGDIFGSLLAIEATAAFFLESTLIGVWIFGWNKLPAKAHATVMWLVAAAGNISALWILLANGWMQHLDATSGGICLSQRTCGTRKFYGCGVQQVRLARVLPHCSGRLCFGGLFRHGHQRLSFIQKK